MPYTIKRYKDGWRVYNRDGTPMSHHPLPLERAKKQKIAIIISERNARGGSVKGADETYSLSDTDMRTILGDVTIFKYPELADMKSIDEIWDSDGRAIMLFLTENHNTGHWICLIKRSKNLVEYFDPYGGFKPDGEREWLTPEKLEELGEDEPLLAKMLRNGGYKVVSNPYKFQKEETGVNTCGRHVVCRLVLSPLSIKEYKAIVDASGLTPDDFVTAVTSKLLGQ